MEELLLIRHGEKQKATGVNYNADGALTDLGIKQVCSTAAWLNYYFKTEGYVGFCSPYMRTLQTASFISEVTEIDFHVAPALREYRIPIQNAVELPNRSVLFQNLEWNVNEWSQKQNYYPAEAISDVVDRMVAFYEDLKVKQLNKVAIVSHWTPIVILSELATNKDPEDIKKRMKQAVDPDPLFEGEIDERRYIFTHGVKESSLTWVVNGEQKWFSKVVY